MNEDILRKIELACEQVYNAPTNERNLAEQQLSGFGRVESIGDLKILIEKSKNPLLSSFQHHKC